MSGPLYLGVDVGTGSARAGLFTADGRQIGRGVHPITTWKPAPDHVEQSSDDIWMACCRAVQEALRSAAASPGDVRGIGFDATCSLVALDAEGQPVTVSRDGDDARNVVVWMDHRATRDALEINATAHRVLEYVGGAISPEMQTPKLRWLKRELPRTWQRTCHWLDLPDFLTWRATGSTARSLCSTVCKWTYLGHEARWDASYFHEIGLGDLAEDRFARLGTDIRSPGECIGVLSTRSAAELGLEAGTPVGVSLIDAHAGALGTIGGAGSDIPMDRRMAVIAGTSACHLALVAEGQRVRGVWGPYHGALLPGRWLLEAGISASGAFLDHALRGFCAGTESDALRNAEQALQQLEAAGTTAADLTRDFHLQCNVLGNRAPLADPGLTGGLAGWTLRSDGTELARWYLAALQSLAYATRHIVEAMRDAGVSPELLVVSGGCAANPRWCQVHADALGLPIAIPQQPDGVVAGSAMLGACAAGAYASLEDAAAGMNRIERILKPNVTERAFHDAKYAVYRRMIDDQRAYAAIMRSPG